MTVEFLYFEGCPAEPTAFALLERVMEEEKVPEPVQRIAVPGPDALLELRFLGLPSIRIDGVDLEGPNAEDELGFGWRCRQYSESEPGESKAVPSAELIRRRLKERA